MLIAIETELSRIFNLISKNELRTNSRAKKKLLQMKGTVSRLSWLQQALKKVAPGSTKEVWDAIFNHDYVKLSELIEKGIILNPTSSYLAEAIVAGCPQKMLALLVSNGANLNKEDKEGIPPIVLSTMQQDESLVELLIKKGADVNAVDYLGWSGLMAASFIGSDSLVYQFLEASADPNLRDQHGRTAMGLAKISMGDPYALDRIKRVLSQHGGIV